MSKKNNLITKSNYLIEAQYQLGVMEQRIILYACTKIDVESKDTIIRFSQAEFAEMFNYKDVRSAGHSNIRKAVNNLRKKDITIIKSLDGEGLSELNVSWVSSVEYTKNWIELEFSKKILPYLIEIKNFTRYDLRNISRLHTKHSFRVYEQCFRWMESDRSNNVFIVEWIKLNATLGCAYKEYKGFRQHVLKDAIEDINLNSDLNIEYSTTSEDGAIKYCVFKVTKKSAEQFERIFDRVDYAEHKDDLDYIMPAIINTNKLKISEENVLNMLSMGFTKERIIESYYAAFFNDFILNRVGWMIKSLKENWIFETDKTIDEIYADLKLYKYILESKAKQLGEVES